MRNNQNQPHVNHSDPCAVNRDSLRKMEGGLGNSATRSMSLAHGKFSLAPGRNTNNRVVINVGGIRYETFKSTLRAIPDTRLSWLTEAQSHNPDYDPATGEYFFDRHPGVFNMILNYYRTGKLHAPTDVCGPLFEEELAFWGIDEKQIEPCCWSNYSAHRDAQETLAELDSEQDSDDSDEDGDDEEIARRFGIVLEAHKEKSCFLRWQSRVWHLLEDPDSSPAAKVLAVISVILILLYIAIFVAESHVMFRDLEPDLNVTLDGGMTVREIQRLTTPKPWLQALEYACVTYFTLEFICRLIFCTDKAHFCKNVLTWVDLLSLFPFYLSLIVTTADPSMEDSPALYVLRSVQMVRIFRIMRLTRFFSGLKILGHTVRASAKELLLLIMVLGIGVLVFACFIYFAEQVEGGAQNDFQNIPIGFWWAVVTMTTLGYGDIYPRTALGYIVGAVCALCGLLMLALPVPVIVNNFTLYYSHAQAKLKLPHKKKNVLVGAADALKNTESAENSLQASNAGCSGLGSSTDGSMSSITSLVKKDNVARKDSEGSASGSTDSGFKTASATSSGETGGISVIFTDELAVNIPSFRSSPVMKINKSDAKRNSSNIKGNNHDRWALESKKGDKAIGGESGDKAIGRRRSIHPSGSMRVDIVDID